MKKNLFLIGLIARLMILAIPALLRAEAPPVIDQGYDHTGAFVAELVPNPNGYDPAAFASVLADEAPIPVPQADGWRVALLPFITESHHCIRLVVAREFGEFQELAPAPREAVALVADAEGNAVVPPEPDNRGAVRRMVDAIADGYSNTPIRSSLATAASLYGLYWLYDNQTSAGGGGGNGDADAAASEPESPPAGSPNATITGDGNVVLFNITNVPPAPSVAAAAE